MTIDILQLTPADLEAVDELMKHFSRTLGFLPKEAIKYYLEKRSVLGAKDDNQRLVGYLLYADRTNYFRITHLCVLEECQDQGIARQLVNHLKLSADTQKSIRLNCRRDYPANEMWPKLGFVPLGEKPSRSKVERTLTFWQLTISPEEQLELFRGQTSTDALDVIIDAQIFFDFDEFDSDKTTISKALFSDFLVDSLELWITDEMYNEINRQEDQQQRKRSQNRTQNFSMIEYSPDLVDGFVRRLKYILPSDKPSSESDIRHLAKAAASNVKIFVTRDSNLLKKSKSIFETIGVEVVDPAALIVQLHELTTSQSYAPDRISGLNLRWKRIVSNDLKSLPFNSFQKYREKQGKLVEKLHSLIVQTEQYKSEILQTGNQIIAIRVLADGSSSKVLTVPLVRIASSVNRSLDQSLFERFLIADTIDHAVKTNRKLVQFNTPGLSTSMIPKLLEMGFIELNNHFVRFCFSSNYQSRNDILSEIAVLCPESESIFEEMADNELEQRCSPVVLDSVDQNYFLIPIKKYYAMNLIDRMESAQDLFGGDPKVLLRWSNVYYRTKDKPKMLKHPAQILWYVSGKQEVIAISRLDEVVIDTAKELFRKFRKFGTLEWRDIYEMCKGDSSKELMALKFSHTFTFRKAISLKELRAIYKGHNTAPFLQGPSRISQPIFQEILQKGYPNN